MKTETKLQHCLMYTTCVKRKNLRRKERVPLKVLKWQNGKINHVMEGIWVNIMPRKFMKTIQRKTLQMNQTRILKQVQEHKERQENATVRILNDPHCMAWSSACSTVRSCEIFYTPLISVARRKRQEISENLRSAWSAQSLGGTPVQFSHRNTLLA